MPAIQPKSFRNPKGTEHNSGRGDTSEPARVGTRGGWSSAFGSRCSKETPSNATLNLNRNRKRNCALNSAFLTIKYSTIQALNLKNVFITGVCMSENKTDTC